MNVFGFSTVCLTWVAILPVPGLLLLTSWIPSESLFRGVLPMFGLYLELRLDLLTFYVRCSAIYVGVSSYWPCCALCYFITVKLLLLLFATGAVSLNNIL
jgi:hypothetical protein